MKKIIIIVVFIITSAEIESQIIHSIYQKTGISISKIDWNVRNMDIYTQTATGITTGLGVTFLNNKYWNLNSQLMILQVGGKDTILIRDEYGNISDEQTSRLYFNYLTLNTTIRVKFPLVFLIPSIKVGPRIDYLMWSDISSDNFKKYNYGLDVGILISKALNEKLDLGLEATYNLQLNKIAKTENLSIKSGEIFVITLGMEYNL